MSPAAVLTVIIEVRRVNEARAALSSVNSELVRAESNAARVGNTLKTIGSRSEYVGRMMTKYVAGPLLAIGAASGYMSAKFHRSMNLIATDAGGSRKEVRYLSREVLKLGEDSEFGPQKLGDSLFYIESAGVRGKEAIADLNKIQKAAMAGNAGLEEAVFGTVGAMNALGKEGKNVEQILATMNSVVGHGHMRLEDLTKAMSTGTLGAAKTFGLTFKGFGGALAFFTRMSEPAQQAATRMRQTITHLAASPTNKAAEALESIGMSTQHMSEKIEQTGRLGPVLVELEHHLERVSKPRQNQILTDAFGGGRYGTQIREALSNTKLLIKTEEEVFHKATIKRLRHSEALQEESDMVRLKKLWSTIEVQLIRIGDVILPIVVPMLEHAAHAVADVAGWFGHLGHGTQQWIVYASAAIIVISLLLRIVGGFIKSLGEIVLWFDKSTEATAVQTEANMALAESYDAAAAAALEARGAMESQYGPYAGGRAANKLGLPVESDLALGLRGTMSTAMKSMVSGIPGMFAAYGIGNIITSVMSGDMQDAGAEGAGALIGGMAAVLTGNPELAGLGVGIGSFVGELASHAFSDIFSSETNQELLSKRRQTWMHNYRSQFREASKHAERGQEALHENAQELHHDKRREIKTNHEVAQAEHHLTQVRAHFGETSRQAVQAQAELNQVKHKSIHVDKAVEEAERQHGVLRKATMRQDRAEVAAAKELIERVSQDRSEAIQKLARIEKQAPSQERFEKESKWLKRVKEDSEELHKTQSKMWETIKTAGHEVGPGFAKDLEKINPTLNRMKEASREAGESLHQHMTKIHEDFHLLAPGVKTIGGIAKSFKGAQGHSETFASTMAGPFTSKSDGAFKQVAENAQRFQEVTMTALGATNTEATNIVEAWGGTAPTKAKEHQKHHEVVKKARGGFLPGVRSGDRIPALLEDGEYIVNREAVKKVGRHNLDRLNFGMAPRYAEGGAVEKAMREAQAIKGTPYIWGGGHQAFSAAGGLDCSGAVSLVLHAAGLLGKAPLTSSGLMNWGLPGSGPITVFANPTHAWMSIQGHPYGTSVDNSSKGLNFYPQPPPGYKSSFTVRHANVAAAALAGGAQQVKEHHIAGAGKFAKVGNAQVAAAANAANKWITKHAPGEWGGGDIGEGGPPGSTRQVMREISEVVNRSGGNKVASAGIIGNAYRESLLNPGSEGTGGGGLWGFTSGEISLSSLKAASGRAQEPWTSVPFQTGFMLRHGGESLLPSLNKAGSPEAAAKAFMEEWEHPGIPALEEREQWARKAFNMGFSKGGPAKAKQEAEPPPQVTKAGKELQGVNKKLHKAVGEARHGHGPKAGGMVRKALRDMGKVEGLGDKRIKSLIEQTEQVQAFQEYASNAGAQNVMEEEPPNAPEDWFAKTIFGEFLGHDEGFWLVSELESLGTLRNSLLGGRDEIKSPLYVVGKMVKQFKHMMHEAEKHVRHLVRKEHELERDIKKIEKAEKEAIHKLEAQKHEVEAAEHLGVHKLEKEKNELENTLSQLQNAQHPNKGQIAGVRNQIKAINEALHGTQQSGANGVKGINEAIHSVEKHSHDEVVKDNKEMSHVKKALSQAEHNVEAYTGFVPQLEEKRTAIQETAEGLMNGYQISAGPYKGKSWEGLTEIQGRVKNYAPISPLPQSPSDLGGNILSVQEALQAYSAVNTPPKNGAGTGSSGNDQTEALKQLEKEIETINLQRELIRQAQGPIMESMPSVRAIAMPYAGAFASGGMVAATVGERGEEIAVMPHGSHMLSHYDAKNAVRESGRVHLNFEHLEFHEATGKVVGRVNGEDFEQDVGKVNRKLASRASRGPTPGGTVRRSR